MQLGYVKRVRESFSAKIIMLVASSVILTSFVVGLTTTRSTGKFLTDRMKDRFPSMLTTTTTRLRLWSDHRRNDAEEISKFSALRLTLSHLEAATQEADKRALRVDLGRQLHSVMAIYPEFEDILLLDSAGTLIASGRDKFSEGADDAWVELGQMGFDAGVSSPVQDSHGFHQWVFAAAPDASQDQSQSSWIAARVNLAALPESAKRCSGRPARVVSLRWWFPAPSLPAPAF
jgi:hypothetical protein